MNKYQYLLLASHDEDDDLPDLEKSLDNAGSEGFRFVGVAGRTIIMEREVSA